MIKDLKELLLREIHWTEEAVGGIVFHATVDGELCILRVNNYPEEPLYTVICRDLELELDDKPEGWSF